MRQIFASPRVENVETVQQVLEDAGIPTRISNRSTWNRATKRDFSYTARSDASSWPTLWVLEADDYPKARELLKAQGIEVASTRAAAVELPSYVPSAAAPAPRTRTPAQRARLALVAITLAVATVVALRLSGVMG